MNVHTRTFDDAEVTLYRLSVVACCCCATSWKRKGFTYYTHGFSQPSYFLIRNPLVSYSFSSHVFVEVVFSCIILLVYFSFLFFLCVRCWYFIHTSCDDIPSLLSIHFLCIVPGIPLVFFLSLSLVSWLVYLNSFVRSFIHLVCC